MVLDHIKDPVLKAKILEAADPDYWKPSVMRRKAGQPEPASPNGGRITLRLPRQLHEDLARSAANSRTSMNSLIVMMLARAMGEVDARGRR